MATEQPEAPEGFTEVDSTPDDTDEIPTTELSPGESFTGLVLERNPELGFNGMVIYKDTDADERRRWWHNGQTRSRFDEADVEPGDEVHVVKTSEEATYEDDDGEEVPYNLFKVYVK